MTNFQLNHNCTTQQVFQRETLGICFINLPPSLDCRNFALCRIVTEHIQACRSLSKIHGIWLDTANPRLKAAIPRKEALEARKAEFQTNKLWHKCSEWRVMAETLISTLTHVLRCCFQLYLTAVKLLNLKFQVDSIRKKSRKPLLYWVTILPRPAQLSLNYTVLKENRQYSPIGQKSIFEYCNLWMGIWGSVAEVKSEDTRCDDIPWSSHLSVIAQLDKVFWEQGGNMSEENNVLFRFLFCIVWRLLSIQEICKVLKKNLK